MVPKLVFSGMLAVAVAVPVYGWWRAHARGEILTLLPAGLTLLPAGLTLLPAGLTLLPAGQGRDHEEGAECPPVER